MEDPVRSEISATGIGFGLTVLSIVFGVFGVLLTHQLLFVARVAETDYATLVGMRGIQFGFLLLAGVYISFRGNVDRFVRVGVPDVEGIAWIVGIPVAMIVIGFVLDPALGTVGIERGRGGDIGVDPTATAGLFLAFFVTSWIVGAPAEELLFQGVIQGRLRETFSATASVLLAAFFFSLFHVLIGPLDGMALSGIVHNGIETFVGGLAFAAAYERTNNLVVPSVAHATFWTMPFLL